MKTKTKMIAFVEIAIVLCSMLLVALPAIAAEQNTQKASISEVTTASEDDYVLEIYGNANEDDTIDMRDLTYVKLIFFGKKSVTELADAKYDGKINPLDFIQIKLIIVGKEKELTLVQYIKGKSGDFTEEPVTVNKPIERIIVMGSYQAEAVCAFGAQDRIVGVSGYTKKRGELKTFLEDKTVVGEGGYSGWDLEKIIELKPEVVLTFADGDFSNYREKLNTADIPLVQTNFYKMVTYPKEIRNFGWMIDKQERAEKLINFEQQYLDLIEERVKDLEDEQKPRVYYEYLGWPGTSLKAYGPGSGGDDAIIACGGINIFADTSIGYPVIDPEAVLERNPQVIIKAIWPSRIPCGYDVTDTGLMEELRNSIMSRPGWNGIDAVEDGCVYLLDTATKSTHSSAYRSYIAKYLHPELFEDIDPVDIHREWIETFLGIDYKGMYAYPPYPVS